MRKKGSSAPEPADVLAPQLRRFPRAASRVVIPLGWAATVIGLSGSACSKNQPRVVAAESVDPAADHALPSDAGTMPHATCDGGCPPHPNRDISPPGEPPPAQLPTAATNSVPPIIPKSPRTAGKPMPPTPRVDVEVDGGLKPVSR